MLILAGLLTQLSSPNLEEGRSVKPRSHIEYPIIQHVDAKPDNSPRTEAGNSRKQVLSIRPDEVFASAIHAKGQNGVILINFKVLRENSTMRRLIACTGLGNSMEEASAELRRLTGADLMRDVDAIAISSQGYTLSGDFSNSTARPTDSTSSPAGAQLLAMSDVDSADGDGTGNTKGAKLIGSNLLVIPVSKNSSLPEDILARVHAVQTGLENMPIPDQIPDLQFIADREFLNKSLEVSGMEDKLVKVVVGANFGDEIATRIQIGADTSESADQVARMLGGLIAQQRLTAKGEASNLLGGLLDEAEIRPNGSEITIDLPVTPQFIFNMVKCKDE
jgi:hypothetical protein